MTFLDIDSNLLAVHKVRHAIFGQF